MWWRFVGGFTEWDAFKTALVSEFSSVDAKRRLKEELDQRTQHPEENLKEFIYTIAAYYERIGEEVPESEKVNRVVQQMHPQLQDLAEGKSFATLAELAKAADELTQRAWGRYQYRPPPPPGSQVARDLAFCPTVSNTCGQTPPRPPSPLRCPPFPRRWRSQRATAGRFTQQRSSRRTSATSFAGALRCRR